MILSVITPSCCCDVLSMPAIEWIWVVSRLSSNVIGGKMDWRLLASRVLPAPGGPINIAL